MLVIYLILILILLLNNYYYKYHNNNILEKEKQNNNNLTIKLEETKYLINSYYRDIINLKSELAKEQHISYDLNLKLEHEKINNCYIKNELEKDNKFIKSLMSELNENKNLIASLISELKLEKDIIKFLNNQLINEKNVITCLMSEIDFISSNIEKIESIIKEINIDIKLVLEPKIETNKCSICFDSEYCVTCDMACGHDYCINCAVNSLQCFDCRKNLIKKHQIYTFKKMI